MSPLARSLLPRRSLGLFRRASALGRARQRCSGPLEYASSCYLPTTWLDLPLVAKREHNHDSTLVAHVSRASLDPGSDGRAVAAASAFSGPELLEVRNLRRRVRAGRMLYASELALLRRYVEAKREELGEEAAVR